MKRLAFFVEGNTELLFLDKIIQAVAGRKNLEVCHAGIIGGARIPKQIVYKKGAHPGAVGQCDFYILIFDCMGDETVVSRMKEESVFLHGAGYEKIIGLRDVRPNATYAEVPKLQRGIDSVLLNLPISAEVILSVMEIESLFLAEVNHYKEIHSDITVEEILNRLNLDVVNGDMQVRENPADDLNDCYQIAGRAYRKKNASRTIDSLDENFIYLELTQKFNSVKNLIDNLEVFFSSE